jgi:5-methylthioadenosine/S-adenosylhomocysteine deaminase
LNAKATVEMATIEGARALHMEKEIGSLEAGKKADLVLLDLDKPNAVPMYEVYAQIAYALKGSDVSTVIIGGKPVMRDRKLLTVNEAEAVAQAQEYKKKIAASLGMQ